jgi:fructose-1,6-bisphosphatase I
MAFGSTLELCLKSSGSRVRPDVAAAMAALARGAAELSGLIAQGPLAGDLAAERGAVNAAGDGQKELDLVAHDLFVGALRGAPVATVASEEWPEPVALDPAGTLGVVIDPLDGSANIGLNVSVGTIFGIYAAAPGEPILRPGSWLIAAGFVVYGPQTSLVVSLGGDVQVFTLDRRAGAFRLTAERVAIPANTPEYAINASNYRHWDEGVRAFIDDCVEGAAGPREADFNMRWIASLVADTYRILTRGGVFLYPADRRRAYAHGRLRLVYEANPIAFLVERAGGAATDGARRILDLVPASLHERTPLIFGCPERVACVERYLAGRDSMVERSPLFGRRGLLRA